MISSQYRESARDSEHPLNKALSNPPPDREMKRTALDTSYATVVHGCDREGKEEEERIRNKKKIHTETVKKVLKEEQHPLLQQQAPDVNKTEEQLPRATRRTLAQLRAGKCPLLKAYLHSIEAVENPTYNPTLVRVSDGSNDPYANGPVAQAHNSSGAGWGVASRAGCGRRGRNCPRCCRPATSGVDDDDEWLIHTGTKTSQA